MAHAGNLQTFMGMEDHPMVIDLPMTGLLTDDMDTIIEHMEIHILDGKRLPRQRASTFLCLVRMKMTFLPILDGPKFHDGVKRRLITAFAGNIDSYTSSG